MAMKTNRFTILVAALLLSSLAAIAQQQSLEPSASRLQQHISYLASDALDGRRTGTPGANDAARYVAGEFSRAGLKPGDGKVARKPRAIIASYLQTFPYVGRVELGKNNALTLSNGEAISNLRPGDDWMPLGISANQKLVLTEIVSAGYGITANELNHNDYKGTYSKNQVAVIRTGTPDGDNPHGRFTTAGQLRFKVAAAQSAGVGALLIASDEDDLGSQVVARLGRRGLHGAVHQPVRRDLREPG